MSEYKETTELLTKVSKKINDSKIKNKEKISNDIENLQSAIKLYNSLFN